MDAVLVTVGVQRRVERSRDLPARAGRAGSRTSTTTSRSSSPGCADSWPPRCGVAVVGAYLALNEPVLSHLWYPPLLLGVQGLKRAGQPGSVPRGERYLYRHLRAVEAAGHRVGRGA